MKNTFLKIILQLVLLALFVLTSGCQVKPSDTIDAFYKSIANKNLSEAATFCTESFRGKFSDLPSALRNYNYSIKKIKWDLSNLYVETNGFIAETYVLIEREWPLPARLRIMLTINLVDEKGKYYISSIQSTIPKYATFTTEPQSDDRYFLFSLVRPRWLIEKDIYEPLPTLIKQYDKSCYSWLH